MTAQELDRVLDAMSKEELLALVERAVEVLRTRVKAPVPRSLEGILRGIADPELDVEGMIAEARTAWKRDLEDLP